MTPWTVALQASLTFTVCWSLLKLMSIESVMPSTISFFVAPFSFCLQSFPLLGSFAMSWLFAIGGQSIGASASVSPSSEYSGLISCRNDSFDLLAVQGTLRSLLQHDQGSNPGLLHWECGVLAGKVPAMHWFWLLQAFLAARRLSPAVVHRPLSVVASSLQSTGCRVHGPQ